MRYLDDWLIQAKSFQAACLVRDQTLALCVKLGIHVNLEKSELETS